MESRGSSLNEESSEKSEKPYLAPKRFQNKKLLILGGDKHHRLYQDRFLALHVDVETVQETESLEVITEAIDRSDVVVVVIGGERYPSVMAAMGHCDEIGKAYAITYENDVESVFACMKEAMNVV